jgi:hypothetical protein
MYPATNDFLDISSRKPGGPRSGGGSGMNFGLRDVITIAFASPVRMERRKSVLLGIIEKSDQETRRLGITPCATLLAISFEPFLNLVPELLGNNPFVLALVYCITVTDLSDIDRVLQEAVKRAS